MRDNLLDRDVPRTSGSLLGHTPPLRITLQVPTGLHLEISRIAGYVEVTGEVGDVQVRTGSGDTSLQAAGQVAVVSGSGSVQVQSLTDGEFTSGSGDVRVG